MDWKYLNVDEEKIKEFIDDYRKKKSFVIVVSGLSGAGKDSVVDGLIDNRTDIKRVLTCTTRKPRKNELVNDPYIRLDEKTFTDQVGVGEIFECVNYAGNLYGTNKNAVMAVFDSGYLPILRIDPKGSRGLIELWRNNSMFFDKLSLLYFFVKVDNVDEIRKRLIERGETDLEKRVEIFNRDMEYIDDAQIVINNEYGKLDEVVREISKFIDGILES